MNSMYCIYVALLSFYPWLFLNIAWYPLTYFALVFANKKEVYDSDRDFFRSGREKTIKAVLQFYKLICKVQLDDKMNNLKTFHRTRFTLWDIYLKKIYIKNLTMRLHILDIIGKIIISVSNNQIYIYQ
jgi:hypothetical protein